MLAAALFVPPLKEPPSLEELPSSFRSDLSATSKMGAPHAPGGATVTAHAPSTSPLASGDAEVFALTGYPLEDLLNPSKVVNYERERILLGEQISACADAGERAELQTRLLLLDRVLERALERVLELVLELVRALARVRPRARAAVQA